MRPSPSSLSCVPRRRVGRADLDRSRAGSGPISVWGVVVVGVAHGSGTAIATDIAVPHDSAVPTDTEHARVCNIHHPQPTQTTRTPTEPARSRPSPTHTTPCPENRPTRNTRPVPDVLTRHIPHRDRSTRAEHPGDDGTRGPTVGFVQVISLP